jgi:uncharacterized membrane protein YecN with MAPEG domain
MTTAITCTAILAAMLFILGFNVSRLRGLRGKEGGTQLPTDPGDRLLIAIRAHGNTAEYVPTLIALFLLVGARAPGWWSAALIIGATSLRVLHALGMLTSPSLAVATGPRLVGALGTYIFGVALAVAAFASL